MLIDYLDRLEVNDESRYFNELRSLSYLAKGMDFLNSQVTVIERETVSRLHPGRVTFLFGNSPQLKGVPQDLVACAFHWYSVTACNYVKLVGWLASDGDSKRASGYLKHVLPEVGLWRNKIGAHFARMNPRNDDSFADLVQSVVFPIAFEDSAFYAGAVRIGLTSRGESSSSRTDMKWSLTQVHRRLSERYWPGNDLDRVVLTGDPTISG